MITKSFRFLLAIVAGVGTASECAAASTIDSANRYAYGANIGWLDCLADTSNGAVIGEYVCSGYIYSANVGWINLGNGAPANGIYYQNDSSSDFGVNQDGLGNLRGYAYGANIGWIAFETNGAPNVDLLTGNLSGNVWSANCGWISLSNATAYAQTDSIQQGALAANGLPTAWLLQNFGTTKIEPSADPDNDGMSNAEEYLAGTDPNDKNSSLRITAATFGSDGANPALTWTSVPSRYYYVQQELQLDLSWFDSGLGLISSGGSTTTVSYFEKAAPLQRFFRVQAARPLMP
ncbi:MAG: thrombospondin type 3 repeat-containing protein [Limisphaerales bacterium]